MKNMARNISLLANAFLLILIATGALWGLKELHRQDPTEAGRLVKEKTYFKDYLNSSVQASTKLGLKFPVIETTDIKGRPLSTDFSKTKKGGIVVVLSELACQPCLKPQMQILQHIYERLADPEEMPIYCIARIGEKKFSDYVRTFQITFPVASDTTGYFNETPFGEPTPAVFVIDENNTVVNVHIPVDGKPHLSVIFYNELKPWFDLAEPLAFNLKGVKYYDVITNKADLSSVKHLLY